jgi:oligopeptide transport system substrate-binding protein
VRRGTRVRGATAMAVMTAAALPTASCSGGAPSGPGGVVTAVWGVPQNPLLPGDTNESNGNKVLGSILTGLLSYDPTTSAPVYENAASITTADQQHFTIRIKPGWTFSDGTAVSAASYVDAWNYTALATHRQLNSAYFHYVQGYGAVAPAPGEKPTAATMSGLRVLDATTFTVALTQKFSTWPQTLGDTVYAPLPASFFKDPQGWAKHPVGDGPYEISSYSVNKELDLVPYPGYRGLQKPQNKGVTLKVYADPASAYADLRSGTVDVDDTLPLTELANAQRDLAGRLLVSPAGTLSHLVFPLYDRNWSAARSAQVRQGISMAIDRPLISATILHGTVSPASDWTAPVLGASGGYRAGLCGVYCSYDPVAARKLIEAGGGLPGGSMTISYNVDGGNRPWVDAVCNSINRALGNDRACVGNPIATFPTLRNMIVSKQMTSAFRSATSMDYPLAQFFLQPLYTTTGALNDPGYRNPAFDQLVDQANAAPDRAAANALFQQAEQLLVADMPAIPLWYQDSVAGYSAAVSHVQMDGFRTPVYYAIRK